MAGAFRFEGYAIVSADGMIADRNRHMPTALQNPADQRFLTAALDRAAVLVHGRHSHEDQGTSPRRRRVVLTRHVATIAAMPDWPHAVLWNPAGAPFAVAAAALGVADGTAAILGGPGVYALFLALGYDAFHISCVSGLTIRGGLPIFGNSELSVNEALAAGGLAPGEPRRLDQAAEVWLTSWRKPTAGDLV